MTPTSPCVSREPYHASPRVKPYPLPRDASLLVLSILLALGAIVLFVAASSKTIEPATSLAIGFTGLVPLTAAVLVFMKSISYYRENRAIASTLKFAEQLKTVNFRLPLNARELLGIPREQMHNREYVERKHRHLTRVFTDAKAGVSDYYTQQEIQEGCNICLRKIDIARETLIGSPRPYNRAEVSLPGGADMNVSLTGNGVSIPEGWRTFFGQFGVTFN